MPPWGALISLRHSGARRCPPGVSGALIDPHGGAGQDQGHRDRADRDGRQHGLPGVTGSRGGSRIGRPKCCACDRSSGRGGAITKRAGVAPALLQAIATSRSLTSYVFLGLLFWVVTIRGWLGGQVPSPSAGHMLAPHGTPYRAHRARAQHVILFIFQWLNGRSCGR